MAELVRPNIQKKIADVRAWDDIMHKVHNGTVFIKGIYTSGNSRMAEAGSPEHPKENSRYMHTWDDIMHVEYAKVLYLSKESILQGTHAWPNWFARTSQRKL